MIKIYQNEYEVGYEFKAEGNTSDFVEKALKEIERISNKGWAYGIGDLLEQNSNLEAVPSEDLNGWEKGWQLTEETLVKLGEIAYLTYKKIEAELEVKKLKSEILSSWRNKHNLSSTKVKSLKLAALMWDKTEQEIVSNKKNFKLACTVLGELHIADVSLEEVFGPAKHNMRSDYVRKSL